MHTNVRHTDRARTVRNYAQRSVEDTDAIRDALLTANRRPLTSRLAVDWQDGEFLPVINNGPLAVRLIIPQEGQ